MRGDLLEGPPPGRRRPSPSALPPPAVRRDRLWVGLERLGAKVAGRSGGPLYSAPRPDLAASRGRGIQCSLRPLRPLPSSPPRRPPRLAARGAGAPAGTGPPAPGATARPGRTVLSAPRPRRVAQGGDRPTLTGGRQGSAAMSATHPTRLETRTKESNARASQRVSPLPKPRGAMKVRAGARRLRWDPGPPPGGGSGRTTGPSRPHRRGGGA